MPVMNDLIRGIHYVAVMMALSETYGVALEIRCDRPQAPFAAFTQSSLYEVAIYYASRNIEM